MYCISKCDWKKECHRIVFKNQRTIKKVHTLVFMSRCKLQMRYISQIQCHTLNFYLVRLSEQDIITLMDSMCVELRLAYCNNSEYDARIFSTFKGYTLDIQHMLIYNIDEFQSSIPDLILPDMYYDHLAISLSYHNYLDKIHLDEYFSLELVKIIKQRIEKIKISDDYDIMSFLDTNQ